MLSVSATMLAGIASFLFMPRLATNVLSALRGTLGALYSYDFKEGRISKSNVLQANLSYIATTLKTSAIFALISAYKLSQNTYDLLGTVVSPIVKLLGLGPNKTVDDDEIEDVVSKQLIHSVNNDQVLPASKLLVWRQPMLPTKPKETQPHSATHADTCKVSKNFTP